MLLCADLLYAASAAAYGIFLVAVLYYYLL